MARQTQPRPRSQTKTQHEGRPSVFTCPDCQGTLFEIKEDGIRQFRCRTGHTYSPLSMLEAQDENVERLTWSAIRALSEQAEYIARLRSGVKGHWSYRAIAWQMKQKIAERYPFLGEKIIATPPSEEDTLTR